MVFKSHSVCQACGLAKNGSTAVCRKVEFAIRSVNDALSDPVTIEGEINEWPQLLDKLFLIR